jgi:putative DNA primase/helicase
MSVHRERAGGNPAPGSRHSAADPPCLTAAILALEAGQWPVPITPIDAKGDSPGKRPIAKEWGKERPDEKYLRATFRRCPKAGVGLKLGAEGGIVDIDVDDPGPAAPVLRRMFPDGTPSTGGWKNAEGRFHLLFLWDDRFARYGKAIVKGGAHYPGLEIRIGAAPGSPKQFQSVIPPSLMANGAQRKWNGNPEILPPPDSLFADLDRYALPQNSAEGPKAPPLANLPKAGDAPLSDVELATDALNHLGAAYYDEYHAWVQVGFALHSLGQEGLALWDNWSRSGRTYREGVCATRWQTMGDEGVKLGSLFKWAKGAGWIRPKPPKKTKESANGTPVPPTSNGRHVASEAPAPRFHRTDMGNGKRLAHRHGEDLRHLKKWTKWFVWDQRHWSLDDTDAVARLGKETALSIYSEAVDADDEERQKIAKHAIASEGRSRIDAMIYLAKSEPEIAIKPSDLDKDPWLLNCLNGTLELSTATLREHRREDMITKLCQVAYDPDALCPLWDLTIKRIFAGNTHLISYFQRLCGVALTGSVREQILPILYGVGANGKSTILNALLAMFGPDYAMKATPDLLLVKRSESHPTDRASLFGMRLIVAIETAEGSRLNESMIKELTGSDIIRARRLYEDSWEFKPTHKIMLCTNHRPEVKGTDHAIWRRLKMVPFNVVIPDEDQDKDLPDKLLGELPGILAWCVRGCVAWQEIGLSEPSEVTAATKEYRDGEDILGEFITENCVIGDPYRIKASELYEKYRDHSEESGESPVTLRKFGLAMTERGYKRLPSAGTWYLGIDLRQDKKKPKPPEPKRST